MTADSIEHIYGLSPMQQGMLFHTLYAPQSGVYIGQLICRIEPGLNIDLFYEAWQRVILRHPPLRTAFLWEGLDEPLQVVYRFVTIPWQQHDWQDLSESERQVMLEKMLAEDRKEGFDVSQAPLMRLMFFHLSDGSCYFVWTRHHILLDSWSVSAVLQEVTSCYKALSQGQEALLMQRRPFQDYISWLRQQPVNSAELFWRSYLQGFATPTPLPITDNCTNNLAGALQEPQGDLLAQRRLRGGRPVELRGFALPIEHVATLRTFAGRHQLTLNSLIQGAWALLLNRYSGERDIIFGATVAGRPTDLVHSEKMIGLFINTLPVRVQVNPQEELLSWLTRLQAQQIETRQYEYSSLIQVQGWSEVPRDRSLFESLVVFENYPVETEDNDEQESDIRISAAQSLGQTNYPLVLVIGATRAAANELKLQLGYECARFSTATTDRILKQLHTILRKMAQHSTVHLGDITLLDEGEQRRLLYEWSGIYEAQKDAPTIVEILSEQARRVPDKVALVCGDCILTYEDLDRRSHQLASYLRQQGIATEDCVGVCMDRSSDLAIALLGIMKSGGVYLPLDPGSPQSRLALMLSETRSSIVLTQPAYLKLFATTAVRALCLETAYKLGTVGDDLSKGEIQPLHAAYVIYTSGSTGVPKGVVVSHRALLNHIQAVSSAYSLQENDRILQFASPHFDVSLEELLPAWAQGATVVMWQDTLAPEPGKFSAFVDRTGLSVLNLPSSYWHEWIVELARPGALHPSGLRLVVIGSEKASSARFVLWQRVVGEQVMLCHAYGLTETTITSLVYTPAQSLLWDESRPLPVGRPLANMQAYVLDERLQPVAVGVPGELYIGGDGLARGYLHHAVMTAERFLPHPYSNVPGARLHRTGDRARYLPDGTFELLGRSDAQIKIRGFRIEPAEIEARLLQHPTVREAVVVAWEDTTGTPLLIAYIVVTRQAPAFLEILRRHLQQALPPYMIPAFFVPLEKLPRSSTGKVDPRLLPAPQQQLAGLDTYIAPRTPMEEILAAIWSEVLHLERVGRLDHFFKLGGHSLQATQVVARLRETLQVELPVRAIYDAPTIASLATQLEKERQLATGDPVPAITPAERGKPLPLSFAQQRLWFLDQLQSDNAFYTLPGVLYLRGSLDVAALEKSLQQLIQRHEMLRTTFTTYAGEPVQCIAPHLSLSLPVIQLPGTEGLSQREEMIDALAREEAQRPFNLVEGPLMRTLLLRLNPQEHALLLTFHHIIADGWSIEILLQETGALYTAYVRGQPLTLPVLPIHYADYALWQRKWLQGTILERQLDYWRQQLKNAPAMLALPTDRPRPAVQSYKGARYAFQLPNSLSQKLHILGREEGVTLFMALLAAFKTFLFRYSHQTDIVVGTPISGRVRRETEGVVGLFLNMLALRTQLDPDMTFRDLLRRVRDVALDAYMHQDIPFEKLVEELQPERSLSHSPFFQVMLVLQNTPGYSIDLPGLSLQTFGAESEAAKFDLTLGIRETSEGLRCAVEYSTDLFAQATIARMMRHFQTLLESCVTNPNCRLADLSLLTAIEQQQLLTAWDSSQILPSGYCLHHLIEDWACTMPDVVALVYEEQQMTYAQLNQQANRLAHYLQRQGVGPESRVGLFMTRSLASIIGILGVLKAGGAYVPLDPALPQQRLALLLEEADLSGMLTQHDLQPQWTTHAAPFIVCLDSEWGDIACYPGTNPVSEVQPTNLAYIIYTSGSTGRPNGVMVTHEGICHLAAAQAKRFNLTMGTRVSQWISFSFDASLSEIATAFQAGATLCLAAHDRLQTGEQLLAFLQQEAITMPHIPTPMFKLLPQVDLPYARTIIVGGEALPETLSAYWASGRSFFNAYGPTETTVCATVAECRADQAPTIGQPLPDVQAYILDDSLHLLPVGVPGELYLGGPGVARGYLMNPMLTAERFLPHPFSSVPGMRLYRTGDLVRYRPADVSSTLLHPTGLAASIEFLGRTDDQVKLRGYRIELGEIETMLARHPAVRSATACVKQDANAIQRLVAYAVPEEWEESPSPNDLRHYLREHLPDYMIPADVLLLPELPRLSNGKIDRDSLPSPDWQWGANLENTFVAPHTPIEQALATIWSEVLGVKCVGVHDNFFLLGGDSIQIIQMSARAHQAHLHLTPRQVFQYQTIAELASVVNLTPAPVAEQGIVTGYVPLTPIQYWFFAQDLATSHHYNQAILLESAERLDTALLEQALAQLLRQHDALRLCFLRTDTGWQQRYGSCEEVGPPHLFHADFAHLSPQEQQQAFQAAAAELHASLCLEHGQLLQVGLFDFGSARPQHLLLIIHHLVVDSISWGVLLEDLETTYRQLSQGEPVSLPPKTTSWQYWSTRLTDYAQSDEVRQEADYWLAMQQKPAPRLPVDFSEDVRVNTEGSIERVIVTLNGAETQALVQELPKLFHTQINDVLLTALVYAFQPWTGTARLLIDLEGHGREPIVGDVDLSRTVGWFTTSYPVLLDVENHVDIGQSLLAIKEQLRSIPHHGIGYGLLRYLPATQAYAAQLRGLPQAEISFNYLGQAERHASEQMLFSPLQVPTGPGFSPAGKRPHLLEIRGSISSDQLTVTWLYSKNIHARATIEAVAHRYKAHLQALIAYRPHSETGGYTPSDFPLARLNMKALSKISRRLEKEG